MNEPKCKIVNTAEVEDIPKLVGKNLHQWCLDEGEDKDKCAPLYSKDKSNSCFTDIFDEEIENLNKEDLNQKIMEKKKQLIQLQNFSEEVNDYTDERDLNLLEKINKNKIQEIIYLVLLLIFAWCFGIYIIFNYLKINK